MITHIEGKLVEKTPTYAIIDCNGVGYFIHISLNTYSKIGDSENCRLYTHLAIREDAHTLYGFAEQEERQLFRLLISVSGVGANTARLILSSLSPIETQQAIINGDVNTLKSVKGIGAKSAQRIIVDLSGKLAKQEFSKDISTTISNTNRNEALSALASLGFDRRSAGKSIDKIIQSKGDELTVEELIKGALKHL